MNFVLFIVLLNHVVVVTFATLQMGPITLEESTLKNTASLNLNAKATKQDAS